MSRSFTGKGHLAAFATRFGADYGQSAGKLRGQSLGCRGRPQFFVGREHQGQRAGEQTAALQGSRGEKHGHKPGLHVRHARPSGAVRSPVQAEGPRRRGAHGKNRVHMPDEGNAGTGLGCVRPGHENVAQIFLPGFVVGNGRLGQAADQKTGFA